MARSSDCTEQYAQKVIDSAGIVRDAWFRQLSLRSGPSTGELGVRLHGPSRLPTVFSLFSFMSQFYAPEIDFEREPG
jgi:hypothetical protein